MREASRLSTRMESALKDRRILGKLLLTIVTLLGMLIVVEGWNTPFPYRLGDEVPHGINARIQFLDEDDSRTAELRQTRADEVPYIFVSESLEIQIKSLAAQLRSYLTDIAPAESYEDLEPETKEAFQLTVTAEGTEPGDGQQASFEQEFQAIKDSLDATGFSIVNRIDEIVSDFESLLSPLETTGVLDQAELDRHDIPIHAEIFPIPANEKHLTQVLEK